MEKTTKDVDLAEQLRQQKESLSTLLNHMPAMTFTKDVETGVYLACNQSFAEYAHKETPEGVAGLTDFEIFDQETAAHFVDDDRKALSMDKPYVFYEDVADAVGNPRQFQTTKLKFHDENGRLCLLGMSMDVTEMERIRKKREEAEAAYKKAVSSGAIYQSIVNALVEDYFNLYYVDLETDDYIEYGFRTGEGKRSSEEKRGEKFFDECKKNAPLFIYEDDLNRFLAAMDKEKLRSEITRQKTFIMQYRLMINSEPSYVNLKAAFIPGDKRHVIIGVNNIDAQVKDRAAARRAEEERKSYLRFNALNKNLIVLYLVDPDSGHFAEYIATKDYEKLGIEKEGEDFFGMTYANSLKAVHPEDRQLFHDNVTKEKILASIEKDGVFVLDYRLLNGELPTYVRLKAAKSEENGKTSLLIALLDEDAQIRQEKKYVQELTSARRMATIDGLTGVKNKYAFNEAEDLMNHRIETGTVSEFSVAVFDLNDLKLINDTRGHEVGDEYIKSACKLICTCFKHSPVFRVGGDEFAVIMEGSDYANQDELMERFEKQVLENMERDKTVVAFGSSRFNPQQDKNLRMVFERADSGMYQEKMLLKSLGAASEDRAPDGSDRVLDYGEISVVTARKHILIADDIESNREILGDLLQNDYDIYYAKDGVEALNLLEEHKDEIAVVLLDLNMPNLSGREVMTRMQVDEDLMFIPVIVISIDEQAELDSLNVGAMDFIPKPYPDIEIIKARISRCIELSENRDLIRRTQRDKLTGLLNIDYFLRYVHRYDQHYRGIIFDAVVCNVNHFHSLNEQYGRQFGDLVLRSIGIGMNKLARTLGGIGGRKEGDTFLLYCPHQEDYEPLLRRFLSELFFEEETASKVTLRFGIFMDAQQEEDPEERFICAKAAADSVEKDPQKIYGVYEYEKR